MGGTIPRQAVLTCVRKLAMLGLERKFIYQTKRGSFHVAAETPKTDGVLPIPPWPHLPDLGAQPQAT